MSKWLPDCLAGTVVSSCVSVQVLKYIPVMARPLVLLREQHPVRWTGVYADIEVSTAVQCTLRSYQSSLPATSVGDPDPDPKGSYVFGPPGSGTGSISQRYGSGSLCFHYNAYKIKF